METSNNTGIGLKVLLQIALGLWVIGLYGQEDSMLVTKNYKFRDGVYLNLEEFQNDRPAYNWSVIEASLASNPQTFIVKVESLRVDEGFSEEEIDLDQVWGLSLGGIPYVKIDPDPSQPDVYVFAGMRVRGRICYFNFEEEVTKMVQISAYNPLTGRPFRTAEVPTEEIVIHERILNFYSGEITDFNVANLSKWIKDDPGLWTSFNELPPREAQEKLFKSLLIYLDRNALYIKQ